MDDVSQLIAALSADAARSAGKAVAPVSVTLDWVAAPAEGETTRTQVEITRATRTIVFSKAELRGADDRLLLSGSAVHRVVES